MTENSQAKAETGDTTPKCACAYLGEAIAAVTRGFCSSQTRQHFRNARVEILKGFRNILDERIEHISRAGQKGTTVTVE